MLRYVSGLNQLTARRLYEHRVQNGPFRTRQQLKEVPGFGEATFVQAAGFLKIVGGDNPLDASWIHPESYEIASRVMEKLGCSTGDLANRELAPTLAERIAKVDAAALAGELQVGVMLLKDIVAQLARPGRDPREDLPAPVFKHGAIKLEDLTPSMELSGTVLNVVDFGAFVDIGMHDSGLIHVSQLADKFVRDPHDVIAVGDVVRVWVLEVDKQHRRVSLTMIPPGHERAHPQRHGRPEGRGQPQRPAAGPEPQPRQAGPRPAGPFPPAGQRGQPSGQQGQRPGRPRFERRPPPSQGGQRSESRSGPPPQPKPRPKPVTPITDEMKTGKAPLRSFSDLLQFYDMQKPGSGGKKDEGRKGKDERNQNKERSAETERPRAETGERGTESGGLCGRGAIARGGRYVAPVSRTRSAAGRSAAGRSAAGRSAAGRAPAVRRRPANRPGRCRDRPECRTGWRKSRGSAAARRAPRLMKNR